MFYADVVVKVALIEVQIVLTDLVLEQLVLLAERVVQPEVVEPEEELLQQEPAGFFIRTHRLFSARIRIVIK